MLLHVFTLTLNSTAQADSQAYPTTTSVSDRQSLGLPLHVQITRRFLPSGSINHRQYRLHLSRSSWRAYLFILLYSFNNFYSDAWYTS